MKKTTLLLLLIFVVNICTTSIYAQKLETKTTLFQEGFDNVSTPDFPMGWTTGGTTQNMLYTLSSASAPSQPNGVCFLKQGVNPEYPFLVSPQVDLSNATELTFWAYKAQTGLPGVQDFLVGTISNPTDYTTFTELARFTWNVSSTYSQHTVDLSAYNGTDQHLCFALAGTMMTIVYFDEVEVTGNVISLYSATFNVKDENNAAIENATVTFGENTQTTDANGQVVFTEIEGGDYSYTVSAEGYVSVSETVTINSNVIIDVTLPQESNDLFPPVNLDYFVEYANEINLSWSAPQDPSWLHWDNGENADAIGLTNGGTFVVASRWTPEYLENSNGKYLTKIQFYIGSNTAESDFEVRVWTGANAANLVTNQSVSNPIVGNWNTIELDNPVLIDATDELWFGYAVINQPVGENPAGNDAGPVMAGYGDMISLDGTTWNPLSSYGFDCNWNLWAYVAETADGKAIATKIENIESNDYLTEISSTTFNFSGIEKMNTAKISNRSFVGYNIYRNNVKINDVVIEATEYQNIVSASGSYLYHVTAVYTDGESSNSNAKTVEIDLNQIERNLVLIERGTGVWCQYCPAAANGCEELIEEGYPVGVVAYHAANSDPFETPEGLSRLQYYGISSFPTAVFDGLTPISGGGNASQTTFEPYLEKVNSRLARYTSYDISVTGSIENQYKAVVQIDKVAADNAENLVLFAVLTESNIPRNWQGMTVLHHVQRAIYPNANGTSLNFASSNNQTIEIEFTPNQTWNVENCELLVFVQNLDTKEIQNTAKIMLSDFTGDTFSATLNVVNQANEPLSAATIVFNGQTEETNEQGEAVFENLLPDNYEYTVSATGYESYSGTVEISENVSIDVVLNEIVETYTVTFIVTDETTTAVENANVTFNGTSLTTNSSGECAFTEVVAGNYNYTVVADNFIDLSGSLSVTNQNVAEIITLSPTGSYEFLLETAVIYPNPIAEILYIENAKNISNITIFNLLGEKVLQFENFGNSNLQLDVEMLKNGIYIIQLIDNSNNTISKRIIKN